MGNSQLNESFACAVRLYRKARHLSAEECAKELGIGKTSLLKIERQQANPTLETVETVAMHMGQSPLALLGCPDSSQLAMAMLLMECLENPHTLNTLIGALDLIQAGFQILAQANQTAPASDAPEDKL